MRPGTAKSIKSAYVDLTALKSGRVKFSQKGSKYAAQVHGELFFWFRQIEGLVDVNNLI